MRHPFIPAAIVTAIVSSGCALRQARTQDYGIPRCERGVERDLLSPDALQCWFDGDHGQWRMLNHQSHLEALVVEVEARDLRDARDIARRVVHSESARPFSEILVYVKARARHGESPLRRIQWTRGGEFKALDFTSPAADSPLTVTSTP